MDREGNKKVNYEGEYIKIRGVVEKLNGNYGEKIRIYGEFDEEIS